MISGRTADRNFYRLYVEPRRSEPKTYFVKQQISFIRSMSLLLCIFAALRRSDLSETARRSKLFPLKARDASKRWLSQMFLHTFVGYTMMKGLLNSSINLCIYACWHNRFGLAYSHLSFQLGVVNAPLQNNLDNVT